MERRRGGRCWFIVDLKSFEISINFVGGKLCGTILERSKGFSSRIRFVNSSLRCLLEGVEVCYREEWLGKVGKGILRGWVLLTDKLCSLGIVLPTEDKEGSGIEGVKEGRRGEVQVEEEEKKRSFVEVVKAKVGRIGDAVWLRLGEFEVAEEAERVMRKGIRCFEDKTFHLERWGLEVVSPLVLVVVLMQGKEWSKVRDEGGLVSHVGSSVGPSREQVQSLGDGAVGPVVDGKAEQVGVVSDLYGMGMVGGAEAGAGKDGKGKGVVEDTGVCSDVGVVLRGKGSGPSVFWAKSDKGLRKGLSLGALGAGGPWGSSQANSPAVSQVGLAQMTVAGGLNGVRASVVETSCLERRFLEVILGAASLAEARGKSGADESLLEEASRGRGGGCRSGPCGV
ncbi:hypothetical protein CK203_022619 [Vitis vinifera]|uniref:DUF4283 domain-containing protein n=1 Tax=Vitis vinifera TaxID=29760 RepID=A0A438JE36_VITVI|nr:hypothetical protein CK203_022619 [Vitis vinifera]